MFVRVLIAVDPLAQARRLAGILEQPGLASTSLAERKNLWDQLKHEEFDLVILSRDRILDPISVNLATIRQQPQRPEVIVISEREDPADRAALLASGCMAVLDPTLPDQAIQDALRTLVKRRRDEATYRLRGERPEERYSLQDFISDSPTMTAFLDLPRRLAATNTSILILGETGSGKERLARSIHAESPRADGPFLAVNCGAVAESLLESELFGHERGAFTGAVRARKGYFELAHRGTLFLDEIGEMRNDLQVRLLGVLESRALLRVGGEQSITVDVRIMAASNRDLEIEVQEGRFRQDLYYRLAVATLMVPSLRERREDIPRLVAEYIDFFRLQTNRRVRSATPEAIEAMTAYPWPGNVRELINVVEMACLLCPGEEITPADLPGRISRRGSAPGPPAKTELSLRALPELFGKPIQEARREAVAAFERRYLSEVLSAAKGRIRAAAERAGINERSLYELMRKHDIRKEDYR